ncbi:TPA: hypothetical protein ACF9H0_002768 [Staphylococcus aureus]|nr:hypothetical protein [Staphylococcus aureus]HDA5091575.1 hypothetical protein [Staphylococcus aureus]HDE3815869.1 hypothetical protein [Staphylococcus aureus]HDE9869582.1 hypothetical protein [Staphylococcus aureus]HDF7720334.1 hypothetical protein [Staphylococcus aureus]
MKHRLILTIVLVMIGILSLTGIVNAEWLFEFLTQQNIEQPKTSAQSWGVGMIKVVCIIGFLGSLSMVYHFYADSK